MAGSYTTDDILRARNMPIYTSDGEKIGHVGEFWVDESDRPEWLKVGRGLLGTQTYFVPVQGSELRDDGFYVPYTAEQVKEAPTWEEDEFTPEYERDLYSAYGREYAGREVETADADQAVTRHEEEVAVGKQPVEAGRARLRKYVETEPVAMDVELQRETARVVREPIDEPVADADFGEEEVEVPLRGEQPVVQKQAVAKERIGLEKDVETERQTVQEDVRRERVEVGGDDRS